MFVTDTLPRPPEVEVSEGQFAALGLIRITERATRQHGPVVTLILPGGRRTTVLTRARHAAFWQDNPDIFHKDIADPHSGVSLTRAVLGPTLLTAAAGQEWQTMRTEMKQILGTAKPWFQRPLAAATNRLIGDLAARPDTPLLTHCIHWATRAICEPLFGTKSLDAEARALVHRLNACFLDLLSSPGAGLGPEAQTEYSRVMTLVAEQHGPGSIARHVMAAYDARDPIAALRSSVGGLLVASLHINALSLFWALVQIAAETELQDALATEAKPLQFRPRRVIETPLALACVRESQRLMPVMAFIERQTRLPIMLDGLSLPAGETVLFSPWMVHRGPDWGNALRFDPGNFAAGRRQVPGRYLPFGIGPRICPGTNLVNQQLTYALSAIALSLRWSPDPTNRPGDRAPVFRVNLEPRGPVTLIAHPR